MDCIAVNNIGKKYKRYRSRRHRIMEWLTGGKKTFHEEKWVLRNISFRIRQGESVGIIGHNGAGKSTLLKIITGTTHPSEGTIQIYGRISALLELGMGLHPDFTGRQNAYTVCQLMGLKNHEIDELIPQIEDFAEIGDYMDRPLRTYSSGMAIRVAFAAATAVRPDILIVDEALSVGDAYFQHKSFNRIRQFKNEGTSLLFVSHDPGAIKTLCDRVILLDNGYMIKDGRPDEVLDYYNAIIAKREADNEIQQSLGINNKVVTRSGNKAIYIEKVELYSNGLKVNAVQVGDHLEIRIHLKCNRNVNKTTVGFIIKDRLGYEVFGTNTYHLNHDLGNWETDKSYTLSFHIPANIGIGSYSITAAVHDGYQHIENNYDWIDQAYTFQVVLGDGYSFNGVSFLQTKSVLQIEER